MLTRRLLTPQSVLPQWDTAVRPAATSVPASLHTGEHPRRSKGTQSPAARASGSTSLYKKLFPEANLRPKKPAKPPKRDNVSSRGPSRTSIIRDLKKWDWKGEPRPFRSENHEEQTPLFEERPIPKQEEERKAGLDSVSCEEQESYNGPSVLVLSAASKSLLESDFYRLGRQAKHLDGWASGIVKVVQARSPVTQRPIGKYFIHFDTRAAAMAYLDEVIRLHSLSRKSAGLDRGLPPRIPTGPMPLTPKLGAGPGAGGDLNDGIRAFTLLPPSAVLSLKFDHRPPSDDRHHGAHGGDHNKVLLWLDGGQVTADTILAAVERDGEDRNLLWRLEDGIGAIAPAVADGRSGTGRGKGIGGIGLKDGQFGRFIVSFSDAVEARRFARNWHKRQLDLPGRDRTAVVNTVALW